MPTILNQQSVAANAVVANIIAGSAFEYAQGPGVMSLGLMSSTGGLIDNINVGAQLIAEAFDVPQGTTYPLVPDSMYFAAALRGGERIVIRSQNTTAGAITHWLAAQFSFQVA